MPDFGEWDKLHLANLRYELRLAFEKRKSEGFLVKDMEALVGRAHGFMALLHDDTRIPWEWHWSTLHDLSKGLHLNLVVDLDVKDLMVTPMLALGYEQSQFMGVGILDSLRATRLAQGMSLEWFGEHRMGLSKSGVFKLEISNDPKIYSMQRYARGLGGKLSFEIGEKNG